MIVNIDGEINLSYVQNLCLIFFPGAKFSQSEEMTEDTPILELKVENTEGGCYARAKMSVGGKSAMAEYFAEPKPMYTKERMGKIVVGTAMYNCGCKLLNYRPPWGILTGIRPAKVAGTLYQELETKTATKKTLSADYLLSPKKAQLATNIAVFENKLLSKFPHDTCSLYVSIPFCPTRCAYCSFVSYSTKRLLSMIPEYLERLFVDIKNTVELIKRKGQRIVTIYIGGGTPTTLNEKELELLLSCITNNVDMSKVIEFTLEAGRPDTLTREKLKVALKYGVTRISVNPQTLNNDILEGIGRKHSAEDFFTAYEMAREVGGLSINTDIIAGLPGDNFASFASTVDSITALAPEAVTVHTFFAKKASDIVHSGINVYSRNNAEAVKCVDYSQVVLTGASYRPYYIYRQKNTVGNLENVGFCLEGMHGYYNSLIMSDRHNIYAVGAGGSTKLVSKDGDIKRFYVPKYPYEYLEMGAESEKMLALYEEMWRFGQ